MKIEVWSDFVCPFCFLGKRYLELAVEKFAHKEKVFITFKSFQLNDLREESGEDYVNNVLAEKYQMPKKQIDIMNERLREQGREIGLSLNFEKLLQINTKDVHRIVKYAETKGLADGLINQLFKAYFTDNENISEQETLVRIAVKAGLEEPEVQRILDSCKFNRLVKEDMELAEEMQVQGVPFFVINEKYALTGAQPVESFLEVLNDVWEREGSIFSKNRKDSKKINYCHGDVCE